PYTQIRTMTHGRGGVSRPCGPDEIGMFQIKGPGLAKGYANPEHDTGARTSDGWLITGDLGRIDGDGFIFVTGRAKDVIIRGGHNIDPALIEEPLVQHADVLHAAAVGKPDSYAGELPVVFVQLVPDTSVTTSDLLAYLVNSIAERAAIPKEIFVVEKLQLTDVGKPDKAALRQQIAEQVFRRAISEATGISSESDRLTVSVHPHAQLGTQVSIAVTLQSQAERAVLANSLERVMGQFAFPYEIEWRE
ncbi:MAG: acyl-CoA synthetase, partial [Hyphomicrobiales bacterium]